MDEMKGSREKPVLYFFTPYLILLDGTFKVKEINMC